MLRRNAVENNIAHLLSDAFTFQIPVANCGFCACFSLNLRTWIGNGKCMDEKSKSTKLRVCNLCGLHTVKATKRRLGGSGVWAVAPGGRLEIYMIDKAIISYGIIEIRLHKA